MTVYFYNHEPLPPLPLPPSHASFKSSFSQHSTSCWAKRLGGGGSLLEEEGVYMWRPLAEGVPPHTHTPPASDDSPRTLMLVCPPVVAVVCRLVDLRLLLDGGVLTALASAALSVLLQVVVQNLRMGLLMRCQDVHEGRRSVSGCSRGVDGSSAPQSRGKAERGCWRAGVETLFVKRLRLCVNRP